MEESPFADAPHRISNAEALEALLQHKASGKKDKRFGHRIWIQQRVVDYLKAFPSSHMEATRRQELRSILQSNKKRKHVTEDSPDVDDGDDLCSGFGLSDNEAIAILDFMPTEPVDLFLLIANFGDMAPRKQEALSDLIASYKVKPSRGATPRDEGTVTSETIPIVKVEIAEETL